MLAMQKKPQDLLEFLRRTKDDTALPAVPSEQAQEVGKSPRMLVLRRSQAYVAAGAAGAAIILAVLLGVALGSSEEKTPVTQGVWVIRVISYKDTQSGRENAANVARQLEQLGWEEVTLQHLPAQGRIVVTLGSWLGEPRDLAAATELRKRVREIADKQGGLHFKDADFWRIER